jgi:RNA methyltransferase, TrmH family
MITSPQNPKVKLIRQLQDSSRERRQASVFVIEGVRLVEEALLRNWPAHLVLYSEEISERGKSVVQGFSQKGVETYEVTASVLRAASDTGTPQGLLAVLQAQVLPIPEVLDFVFIPDSVRDPGNLGTMLRTAAATGVQAVLIPPGTVDPFSPKVLRSAMGAHFCLPVLVEDWNSLKDLVRRHALHCCLAAAGSATVYTHVNFHQPVAVIVGGEAEGASQEALLMANEAIQIPMTGQVESLNAAVAAAVLFYEVVRQRSL